jgi:putative heme-binding domain-containing protein
MASDLLLELALPHDTAWAKSLRHGKASELMKRLVAQAQQTAADATQPIESRLAAIDRLALADWRRLEALYDQLLDAAQPLTVQLRAVEALEYQTSSQVAQTLLARWPRYSPSLKQSLLATLMTRNTWQTELLAALEAGAVPLQELTAAHQQQLARTAGSARWNRLQQQFSVSRNQDIETLLDQYRSALQSPADPAAGQAVFRTACAPCHRLEAVGHEIGPNLAAMQNRGVDAILINVLDPNREVNPQFIAYTALTRDGRVISGMIRNETATSIELVQADNKSETLLRDDIESLVSTNQSMMPTGMEQQISPAAMNDLISYLRSLSAF